MRDGAAQLRRANAHPHERFGNDGCDRVRWLDVPTACEKRLQAGKRMVMVRRHTGQKVAC